MVEKQKSKDNYIPLYMLKLKPLEAFVVLQLINSASLTGNDVDNIYHLKQKFQKLLEKHKEKTGEFVGYSPPPAVAQNGA
jgi:hypothetical protein